MSAYFSGTFAGLKWLFFDLDDTLWDFSANSDSALDYLYGNYAVLRSCFGSREEFGDLYHAVNDELWALYHHAKITQDFLKRERFERILRPHLEPQDAIRLATELNVAYLDNLASHHRIVPGAKEVLEAFSGKYLIGMLSNGFQNVQYRKLYGSGLDRYVQRLVVSDEIGVQKPDKRLFDYVLQETGAKADEVLFIGDNPDADIRGALDAGWRAIYFDRKYKGPEFPDAPTIRALPELLKML